MSWGIHHIQTDDRYTPRKGLFIEREYRRLIRITLLLAFTGRKLSLQTLDFDRLVAPCRTEYWLRISVSQFWKLCQVRWGTDAIRVPTETRTWIREINP